MGGTRGRRRAPPPGAGGGGRGRFLWTYRVSIAGSVVFGWVSDRIGGIRALALIAFNAAILWIVLLLPLPFHALLVVAGLLGMHGAGAIPSLSRGVADIFGKTSFSRVYGLTTAATLPMTLLGVMGTGAVYRLNGRYLPAIKTVVGCLLIVVPIALATGRNGGSRQTA